MRQPAKKGWVLIDTLQVKGEEVISKAQLNGPDEIYCVTVKTLKFECKGYIVSTDSNKTEK